MVKGQDDKDQVKTSIGRTQALSDLLFRVADGDEKAFEELYRLTYKPLFSFLVSLTTNLEDARDILQETYLKVFVSAHLYKNSGNPLAWIMKIGKNIFLMQERSHKNDFVYMDNRDAVPPEIPFDNISDFETRELIQELFQILTQQERSIIVLHEISGFKHREIADLLDLPLGTVLSKYNRAIRKLRSHVLFEENR